MDIGDILTAPECARLLKVTPRKLRRWVESPDVDIPYLTQPEGQVFFCEREVAAWVHSSLRHGRPPKDKQ